MHIAFKRLAAGFLRVANNILPETDGRKKPPTEAERANAKDPVFRWWKYPPIQYDIPKEDFARIFHLRSALYTDEPIGSENITMGRYIRHLAGYRDMPGGLSLMTQHGFGNTRALRVDRSINLYVNEVRHGHLSSMRGLTNTLIATARNIPKALLHAKTFNALVSKASNHEPAGRKCELAIVARRPIIHPERKQMIFALRADFIDGDNDKVVTLRDIFRPVVNADGAITGTTRIDPRDKDATTQTLRALILCKVIADKMAENKAVDVAGTVRAVDALPLTEHSKIKDYLMFQPE